MNREKMIAYIIRRLEKASLVQLRVMSLVAHHVIK